MYKRLPFGATSTGNKAQRKRDKILKEVPNVFGTADDILVRGYDHNGREHDNMLW